MNDEMDFLRWFYHRLRLKGDNKFEREIAELYTKATGKRFPYKIVDDDDVS